MPKILGTRNFEYKNNGPKKFRCRKVFDPSNFWVKFFSWSKTNVGSLKIKAQKNWVSKVSVTAEQLLMWKMLP